MSTFMEKLFLCKENGVGINVSQKSVLENSLRLFSLAIYKLIFIFKDALECSRNYSVVFHVFWIEVRSDGQSLEMEYSLTYLT